MFFTKYTRGRPKPPAWNPTLPLYVCEFRYKDDVKAFKKIKSWSSCVPEEIRKNEYEFEPFGDDRVEQLVKVKSPFVRGVAGPGGLDSGNAPAAAYHFSQDGKPATAEEVDAGFAPTKSAADPVDNVALAVEAATALQTHSALDGGIAAVGVLAQTGLDSTLEALGPFDSAGLTVTAPAVAGESDATAPTPAELAVASEAFEPLPAGISASFHRTSPKLTQELSVSAPLRRVQVPQRCSGRSPVVQCASSSRPDRFATNTLARVPVLACAAEARDAILLATSPSVVALSSLVAMLACLCDESSECVRRRGNCQIAHARTDYATTAEQENAGAKADQGRRSVVSCSGGMQLLRSLLSELLAFPALSEFKGNQSLSTIDESEEASEAHRLASYSATLFRTAG